MNKIDLLNEGAVRCESWCPQCFCSAEQEPCTCEGDENRCDFYEEKRKVEGRANLNALRDIIYADAVAHGLWEGKDYPSDCAWAIKEEAQELCDAGNDWEDDGWYEGEENEAFSEELADVVIMCFSVAGKLGIDIDAAVRRKMEINKGRPWKHGKVD